MILHVYYTCRPGMAGAFVRALKEGGLQDRVRAEDGCLQYDYCLSCEEPDTVVLIERWRDEPAQSVHMAQPHMEDIRRLKEEYTTDTKVERIV